MGQTNRQMDGGWTFIYVMLDYSTYFQFNGDILYELDLRYIWDTWLRDICLLEILVS